MVPIGEWIFVAASVSAKLQKQTGFRYIISSTTTQTMVVMTNPPLSGQLYHLAPNATFFVGGDYVFASCHCDIRYARVYTNFFANAVDEFINLAIMDIGNTKPNITLSLLTEYHFRRNPVYHAFQLYSCSQQ